MGTVLFSRFVKQDSSLRVRGVKKEPSPFHITRALSSTPVDTPWVCSQCICEKSG